MFDNIPLAQFYAIGFDMRDPYFVCGGLQDNDAWCGPSNTRSFHGIRNQDWYETVYGDGFFTIVDPTDSTIVFSESQGGNMNRYDLTTGEKTPMRPITGPRENGDTAKIYQFNWNSPLQLSPHDPATVYLGANYLMRSRDHGMTWEEVGGIDLTKQIDRETLEIMGVSGSEAQLSINDGISTYGNLTTLAESPLVPGLIYIGTDDGNLQVTRDDGSTWENVVDQIPGLPDRTYVSRVEASSHADGRVYATFDGHRNGDYAPYVYLSEDYGQTWDPITGGLPDGWSVNVIVEHHRAPNLLFLGNEVGVYVSVDRGQNWARFKNNLPVVPVDDILIHPRENDLIVGTHGRGMYIMSDVTPLEHLSPDMLVEAGRVFPSRSIMWAERGDWPFYGATFSAPNPPRGARIRYYLRDAPSDVTAVDDRDGSHNEADGEDFSLTVTDMSGKHVRTLEAPSSPGINEVIWDWRYDPPYERPSDSETEGGGPGGMFRSAPQGPIVMPGNYTVSMEINGESYSSVVEIIAEPRRPMTSGDRIARQNALMSLHVLAKPIHEARQAIDSVNEQLVAAKELIEGADESPEELAEELAALEEELDAIRDELDTARGYTGVASAIQGSSTLPTEDHLWQVEQAWEVVPNILDRLNALVLTRVPALNERLYADPVLPTLGETIDLPVRPTG